MNLLGYLPKPEEASVPFIRAVVNQRNYKSAEEILEIEKACDVTADMHIKAMQMLRPGMRESDVAGALEDIALSAGGGLSFPTIATINGQTLHNHYHGNVVKEGDMLLVDAGAETAMGYAGICLQLFLVSKKFTSRQKDVYDIQVASHLAAVEALRPGIPFKEVYELSSKVL
jgi:Xaa-Pro aminopeptidase